MRSKRFVALGLILGGIAIKIAERRRKAVAAMFVWRTAERPQGILQPSARATKLLPPSTTSACCQPENASWK
jgi:hypothetical protein